LSTLSAMLSTKWKSGGGTTAAPEAPRAGQIRNFKILNLDLTNKRIEVELA
jgi:hypothetical protein